MFMLSLFIFFLDEKVQPKTTEPSGQGDTFTPGEWNPVSSKR
jgi:NADH dehydrogenase [ubiquinone] 1 alpha subcomplex assembly factor 2